MMPVNLPFASAPTKAVVVSGGATTNVFGSNRVESNSKTPYSDATQVGMKRNVSWY